MPASSGLQSKPPPPKNTIRGLKKLAEDDNIADEPDLTSNSDEELSKLGRFGPIYGADTEANQKAKDSAWKHILEKSGGDNDYMRSIADIENDAIDSYHHSVAEKLKRGSEFRLMMARDGCFFLQLALHILGGGELLGYPEQHPYLGKEVDSASSWIADMFFVGNQIPYVVIRALMKQTFFKAVIKNGIEKGTWQRPTEDLAKLVLYLMVVEPELERKPSLIFSKLLKILIRRKTAQTHGSPSPPSILHALHSLLLGPGDNDPNSSEMKEFHELEAGREDDIKFHSVSELYKSGIRLKKAGIGITNIRFQNFGFCAYLYLPPLTIDAHTRHILMSLANYEKNLNESDREVTAYLRFMRDLLHTYKDFKILEKKGILQVKDNKLKGSMTSMLDNLVTLHRSNFTPNFRQTRRKIRGYGGPPWRLIGILVSVLTVAQTIFTVLSYFFPHK